jgi:hypothetical protein
MEGVIHLVHGMFWIAVVGTSATDEIMTILFMRARAGVNDDCHN